MGSMENQLFPNKVYKVNRSKQIAKMFSGSVQLCLFNSMESFTFVGDSRLLSIEVFLGSPYWVLNGVWKKKAAPFRFLVGK